MNRTNMVVLGFTLLLTLFLTFILSSIALSNIYDKDPLIYVYSPSTYIYCMHLTSINYSGSPVVVMSASEIYMPSGEIMTGIGTSYNVTLSIASLTMYNVTIYATNITGIAIVLGVSIPIVITPQNYQSILTQLGSAISCIAPLEVVNVKIYAYYINASSISFESLSLSQN